MAAEWKKKCEREWKLKGLPMPDSVDWKSVYERKPLGRNLLRNPTPHGLTHDTPPPEPELPEMPRGGPPQLEPEGDFTGWVTSREAVPYDASGVPPGAVVCFMPEYSWFTMEQMTDLTKEGLWEELLDDYQPDIVIQDWYEESQVHESIYQLHVKLLGSDAKTVIAEHTVTPTEDLSTYSHTWKEVSHVFSGYGRGVRHIHFQHRLKNKFLNEFFPTLFTGSAVIVKPTRSNQ